MLREIDTVETHLVVSRWAHLTREYETDLAAEGDTVSAADVQLERARKERAGRESEAREHPLTKMVMETFGASIKEIKTDV